MTFLWPSNDTITLIGFEPFQHVPGHSVVPSQDFVFWVLEKDKEVKKRCKADKQQWFDDKAKEAENAANTGDSKRLFDIVKELTGHRMQRTHKLANGKLPKTHDEEMKRWTVHFQEVLIPSASLNEEQLHNSLDVS